MLLAHRGGRAELATHTIAGVHVRPGDFWGDGVPNGGTVRGTGKSVAALVEHYRGMGSTSADGLQAVEELVGWVPERGGVANIGLIRAGPLPDDGDPLRLHRSRVGAHRRGPGRRVRR